MANVVGQNGFTDAAAAADAAAAVTSGLASGEGVGIDAGGEIVPVLPPFKFNDGEDISGVDEAESNLLLLS